MNKTIVSFGEIMLRLSPTDNATICDSKTFSACYGGSESNVLVCLASLGDETQFLTAVPTNELGNAVIKHLNSYNVGTKNILRQGDTLGMYFLEEGFGQRFSKVIYNRKHSQVSKLCEDDFDYDTIFKNCKIFHICGISFSLSQTVKNLCFRMLKEAKKRNIKVSFDFNYRSKLWTIQEAKIAYQQIINYVDILFCSNRDLETFLETDVHNFYNKYNTEYLIVREREVISHEKHIANASIYRKTKSGIDCVNSDKIEFQVLERIGSGDAFVGGVLHSLNCDGDNIKDALNFGMMCFVLKHTFKGDVLTLDENTVKTYINELSKDVIR